MHRQWSRRCRISPAPTHLARSSASFSKREKEKKRQQKQKEKAARKEERKANAPGGGLENMMAYVDENGMIVDTPPDPANFQEVDAEEIELGIPKREEVRKRPLPNRKDRLLRHLQRASDSSARMAPKSAISCTSAACSKSWARTTK